MQSKTWQYSRDHELTDPIDKGFRPLEAAREQKPVRCIFVRSPTPSGSQEPRTQLTSKARNVLLGCPKHQARLGRHTQITSDVYAT